MLGLGTKIVSPVPESVLHPKPIGPPIPKPSMMDRVKEALNKWTTYTVELPGNTPMPTATPTATPTPQPGDDYEGAIREGFKNWGNPPAATLSGTYAKAREKYPVYQKYPFLLPAQSLAETGGGKAMKFKNNIQNWGIVPQRQGQYSPASVEQNVMDAMSGIGERSPYYKKFRETGDLRDFAYNYAPPGENDTEKYIRDLESIMSVFEQARQRQKK